MDHQRNELTEYMLDYPKIDVNRGVHGGWRASKLVSSSSTFFLNRFYEMHEGKEDYPLPDTGL